VTGTQGATVVSAIFAKRNAANIFTNGKQTLALSASGFASLNIPPNGMPPSSPASGDIWTINTDRHLQFQTMTGLETLAFNSDIATANSGTLTAANAYTDTQVAAEATARQAGDASTLSSANAHADAGDVATLSSANTFTSSAVAAEAILRATGDAATLASANT